MWLYRQEPIKVSHHLTKFGSHRYCGSGDLMILVCHVIFQDHVIKGSRYFWVGAHQGKLPFCLVWSRDIIIPRDQIVMWLYRQEPIKVSCHPAKFGSHRHLVVEICFYFVTWSWCNDVTSTCLISLIWVKSCKCTCLPNLLIIDLVEMEIWILISILT